MNRTALKPYFPSEITFSKYIFFTGKGGVGKTSLACATAVALADSGSKVLLISTDPASNLQDVFDTDINNKGVTITQVPNLTVTNLNPEEAAHEYKESIIAPYRGKIPEMMIRNMEEQLSGSCTVEIAAFNEFSEIITSNAKSAEYDYILFDTAPTGHTLRMLELPSAWDNYISHDAPSDNYIGQLSGMKEKQAIYKEAVNRLSDPLLTTLVLVSRPDFTPLQEVARSSNELWDLKIRNQWIVINALLQQPETDDLLAAELFHKQTSALKNAPKVLSNSLTFFVPLRSYNLTGVDNLRNFFFSDSVKIVTEEDITTKYENLNSLVEYLYATNKRVVFTMGKGGVGKSTMAAALAIGLSDKGQKVHLTTTDPADHLKFIIAENQHLSISNIDPDRELALYKKEVIEKARISGKSEEDIAYIVEDLQSPCTKEIAVFRAFADIVKKADEEVIIIDTAPTGHTLLLLDSTESYHREVERSHGDIPTSVKNLLPRLRDSKETEVIIVTLPEATPVLEAERLKVDLSRAGIGNTWWIVNNSMSNTTTNNLILKARAQGEKRWLRHIQQLTKDHMVLVPWQHEELKGDQLKIVLQK
ncbi:arsenite-transporting ATPase [Chitinophaga dinghuensis]|uniref:arsenite-transporting ATPase n=1 Tax=Chitinophaga dinghuensis TaxID=1539050 RepID=A0A327W1Q5_9BACT|nr:arsenical pump-driving ATPase [Chitinophaga dinghuensis]RAJ82310.1 arsenite-transporting ATPase [Chitinophaga dinghuensis]